jgi:hypothetical protein
MADLLDNVVKNTVRRWRVIEQSFFMIFQEQGRYTFTDPGWDFDNIDYGFTRIVTMRKLPPVWDQYFFREATIDEHIRFYNLRRINGFSNYLRYQTEDTS